MPPTSRGATLERRVEGRRFRDPDVISFLDALTLEEVEWKLGPPTVVRRYAEGMGYWRQGDGRPALADDDPAVMQAIGLCLAARVRKSLPVRIEADRIHPEACPWDEYPGDALLAALDWATWQSRYLVAELLVWRDPDDRHTSYERAGERAGTYENQRHRDYWALPRKERAERLAAVLG